MILTAASLAHAGPLEAPPGLFKDVTEATLDGAVLLDGTQLFIDDRLIESLDGARKRLNRPTKHPNNPILVKDHPWEEDGPGYGTVHYDADEQVFKMWYQVWKKTEGTSTGLLCYATSTDGVNWTKPVIDAEAGTNLVRHPSIQGFQCPGIFKDPNEQDPGRRYKMLFSCNPDGTAATWMTSAAFSPDGIHWTPSSQTPLIPFSDTQVCPFWDRQRQKYVAILRFGPPNIRLISRMESDDFAHWSPKITVLRRTKMDSVQQTQFYQMAPFPYAGVYLGLIGAYHNESLKPIPPDQPWTDRQDLQLAFSRNGVTWSRVGGQGVLSEQELNEERDWTTAVQEATFLPYGRIDQDWDWGYVTPYFTPEPILVDDTIHFYYAAQDAKHWWTWTGDPPQLDPDPKPPVKGVGLATLRKDGFVSVEAGPDGGTMTTRPFIFLGDTLELNADASEGSITVAALGDDGEPIPGFDRETSLGITSDSTQHSLQWTEQDDLHQLQGRPIRLRFHLNNARIYSLTPRTHRTHYIPSYDCSATPRVLHTRHFRCPGGRTGSDPRAAGCDALCAEWKVRFERRGSIASSRV